MNGPLSPASAHTSHQEAHLTQFLGRKRSHSEMSQDELLDPNHHQLQPQLSQGQHVELEDGMQEETASQGEEYSSPRGSRSFKRPDAPKNADGKYFCQFSDECAGLVFDRKCEWSKHMDKHDRPYRCQDPECAKLQGFTYSGGLLRHEREVHNKHGGPKSQLMCPFLDCKRHTGKGFTRKENLNEHVRRVHESKTPHVAPQAALMRRDIGDASNGDEYVDTPSMSTRVFDENIIPEELAASVIGKRRHSEIDGFPPTLGAGSDEYEQLQQEVKRLRADNFEKDERLRSMELAADQSREEMSKLQELLQHYQTNLHMGQTSQAIVG